jgi:hypothetical protein
MCPSYLRIKLPKDEAMRRFAAWLNRPELEPPTEVKASNAVDLSCDKNGEWKGCAVFIYEKEGWTVFSDLAVYLRDMPAESWLKLAGKEELVFAGYNDSICYGELVVIKDEKVLREFLDYPDVPEKVNKGCLEFEIDEPIRNWINAASFVDGDDLGYEEDSGTLWIFEWIFDK